MILELLGLGMLGAIGKTVYDEAKKEQSSNNTNQSTTNKNYTDDSRYWNLIYSYARKYQYRKTEISYDILHEIQLKTNRDLSQIKCDYEKALNKINKKAEKAKTASMKNTSPNKNTNTTVHSEPKHNSSKRKDEMNNTSEDEGTINKNQTRLYVLSDEQKNFVTNKLLLMDGSAPYVTNKVSDSKRLCPSHFLFIEDRNEYVILFLEQDYDGLEYHIGLNGIQACLYEEDNVNKAIVAIEKNERENHSFFQELPEYIYNDFKSRLKDNTNDKQEYYSVFNYIKHMSTKELLNAIASEYTHIKGTCLNIPTMGEYGSVEFAGALLIWKYCKEHLYGDKSKICGSLMINLGDTIGCAYLGISAGEWSNKMDMVINNNTLLDYQEWNYIYNYLKENYITHIHKFEFCVGETNKFMKSFDDMFIQSYNQLSSLESVFKLYDTLGLKLKSDMPFTING